MATPNVNMDEDTHSQLLPQHDRQRSSTESTQSRRRHRKQRYRNQGYQKTERENSRRVEARNFLSTIPLDSHMRLLLEPHPQQNQDLPTFTKHGRLTPAIEEGLISTTDKPRPTKLHDMADNLLELYSHHSPVKVGPSKSLDHGFDSPLLGRSASLFESGTTPTFEQRRGLFQQVPHSKSVGSSVEVGGGEVHYCGSFHRSSRLPHVDNRLVLTVSGAPVLISSTVGYKKEMKLNLEHPQRQKSQRSRLNSNSLQFDVDVDLGSGEKVVSLGHLFKPLHQITSELDPTPFWSAVGQKSKSDPHVFTVGATYNDVLNQPLPSSCGASFPWVGFRDHHSMSDVLLHYHPLCLDNYEYFVGPNISTLSVQSYRVSIIQYAKASEVKKGINDQFSETFPHIKITLSKLRSIKKEMYNIAKECSVDMAAVAHAYVYFEKLVLMGKVDKSNRKVVAGVCLLMSAKFFMDMKKHQVKELLEEIADVFRISSEEVVLYELPVLVALQFSLLTPIIQTFTHFERLKDKDISNK